MKFTKKKFLSFLLIILIAGTIYAASPQNRAVFCLNGTPDPLLRQMIRLTEADFSRKRIDFDTFDYKGDSETLAAFIEETVDKKTAKGIIILAENEGIASLAEDICQKAGLPLVIIGNFPGSISEDKKIIRIPFKDNSYFKLFALTMANLSDTPQWKDQTLFPSGLFISREDDNYPNLEFESDGKKKRISDYVAAPVYFSYPTLKTNNAKENDEVLKDLRSTAIKNPSSRIIVSPTEILPLLKKTLIPQGRWLKSGEPGHIPLLITEPDLYAINLLKEGYADIIFSPDIRQTASSVSTALIAFIDNKDLPEEFTLSNESPTITITANNISEEILETYGGEEYSQNKKEYLYLISGSSD